VIVLDAAAAVSALSGSSAARDVLASEPCDAPEIVDLEVASVLHRLALSGSLTAEQSNSAIDVWRKLGIVRHPHPPLLERVWELRHNLSAYDAAYAALAEGLEAELVTMDARPASAPGLRCAVRVLPSRGP